MAVYLTGSLAFDRIMTFPGAFSDHILPGKVHAINVSLIIDSFVAKRGGTAGNIAYSMAMLGEKPTIVASVGQDFGPYREAVRDWGLSLDGIHENEADFTAGAYIYTDLANNQITGFNPGAMRSASPYSFPDLQAGDTMVISPTNTTDMVEHARLGKARGARVIFDPGQQIPALSAEELVEGITGAFLLVCNDYEFEMIAKSTGLDLEASRKLCDNVIITQGEAGSTLYQQEGETKIAAVRPDAVVEPTGAGDAYRAGLVHGLCQGLDLAEAARIGAACASFCVEKAGPQGHAFTLQEVRERLGAVSQ